MRNKICPSCGSKMKKNGKTRAGRQRWRCTACNASATHRNDVSQREFKRFLKWLLSKDRQLDMEGQGRSFRRHTSRFWDIWPMPEAVDEVHRAIFVDGIYLSRNVVVLIACSEDHVLSWYLARSENSSSWKALLENIAPPDMVVTDGGSGFAKAAAEAWPSTRIQRCTFHAFNQVKRCTTSRPKLQAGIELYGLAKDLLHIETLRQAELWVERFVNWCDFWNDFLSEKTVVNGRSEYTHERLRKARRGLVQLVNKGTLFTYLDPELTLEGPLPATNNQIEGAVNSQLRSILRNHRGMSLTRRVKAVFWWCYTHTECPLPASEIIKSMPTDADIDLLYETYAINERELDGPPKWGDGVVWEELHRKTEYPYAIY